MRETKTKWHKFPDNKPPKSGQYLITVFRNNRKEIDTAYWMSARYWYGYKPNNVLAWAKLPMVYRGGRK